MLHTPSYRAMSSEDKKKRDDAWFSEQHTGEKPAPPPAKKWGTVDTRRIGKGRRKAKKTRRNKAKN